MIKIPKNILLIIFIVLGLMCLHMLFSSNNFHIIHNVNLIFHEAGHVFFSFFGSTIHALGGFLGEFFVVLAAYLAFFAQRSLPGQISASFWMSTVFYGTAIYIADSRARVLTLLGGQEGHDWAYILGKYSLLNSDIFISQIFKFISLLCILWGFFLIYRFWARVYVGGVSV